MKQKRARGKKRRKKMTQKVLMNECKALFGFRNVVKLFSSKQKFYHKSAKIKASLFLYSFFVLLLLRPHLSAISLILL